MQIEKEETITWEDGDFIEAGEPSLPPGDFYSGEHDSETKDEGNISHISMPENVTLERKYSTLELMELGKAKEISSNVQDNVNNVSPHTNFFWLLNILSCIPLKWRGVANTKPPKRIKYKQIMISSFLSFIGIFLISITDYFYLTETFSTDNDAAVHIRLLAGAYAASAVLVYEAYLSPLAQPRNVFGSYCITSIIGVSTRIFCQHVGIPIYVAGALALALGVISMNVTKTVHPPGGACALIAVIGGKSVHALGYGYVLTSLGGAFIIVAVAVIGNNLFKNRQYPLYW